jgi:hypothetical protein
VGMIEEGLVLFGFGVGVVALAFGLHVLISYLGAVIEHRNEKRADEKRKVGGEESDVHPSRLDPARSP